ncbi:MAG: hypothetical protein H7Y60_13810, partial [Rhodospirillaceae bacterium]|nr:hypothetical protein [Rhodospirillales bacterium]
GYVVTWKAWYGSAEYGVYRVYAKTYSSTGQVGPDLVVNSGGSSHHNLPVATGLSGGGFVVAWESVVQDGSGTGVYGQRYDGTGAKAGGEFRINSSATGEQTKIELSATADGGFVATWQSAGGQDGAGIGVYGQRYDANGLTVGGEFRINDTVAGDQASASVAARSDGGFVVAWQSAGQDESGTAIVEKVYSSTGDGNDLVFNTSGNETLVGGNGADIYSVGRGTGADVVDNRGHGSDNDTLSFGTGVATNQLWFQRQDNDLKVSIIGTSDNVIVKSWYSDADNRVSTITTASGSKLLESQVDSLVSAMAVFNPPALGQTQLTAQQHQALDTVIAVNWQS